MNEKSHYGIHTRGAVGKPDQSNRIDNIADENDQSDE